MVADLINTSKNWKASAIWNNFSKDDTKEILAKHIPREDLEDEIEWSLTKSGRYTIKSGYWFLQNGKNNAKIESKFWNYYIFPLPVENNG